MADKKVFDNNGTVAMWEKEAASGLSYYSGTAIIEGKAYNVTLFDNERTSEKMPIFKGKIELREVKK